MVTPVRKDGLSEYQRALSTYLRLSSPVAGMFTGSEIKMNYDTLSVLVPDIRVDDYIVDADIARIGASHYEGSEFTTEWKNGIPPLEWREYTTSRRRSFGYTIFDEQKRKSPIPNLDQEYLGRKMQTTVVRDHDKYQLLAIVSGRMTGKLIARTSADTIGPQTTDVHRISCTGNAADYRWIAEPGENFDNEIQPSFATIKGIALDDVDPLKTLDQLTLTFSDNWFDSNFGNSERFLLITSALELVFINALIDAGSGSESAFKLIKDGDISGANAAGYLGTLKGSWKLVKIHPEFLPKVFVDVNLVVDPVADTSTPNRTLKQVVALAAYKNAAQTFEHFSERREEDGGVRFKGKEYVQDFAYDAIVIDQFSEGIVPVFLPTGDTDTYDIVDDSFNNVAAMVLAARAQKSVAPSNYPLSGPDVYKTYPGWYNQNWDGSNAGKYGTTDRLDDDLSVRDTGDQSHVHRAAPPTGG